MFTLLKNTIQLDIFDLNYSVASEELGKQVLEIRKGRKVGLFWRVGSFFFHFLSSAFRYKNIFKKNKVNREIMLFVNSINQKNSLIPLIKQLNNAYLAGSLGSEKDRFVVDEIFPLFFAHLLSLFFLPVVVIHFWNSNGYRKETFNFIFDSYWLTYGYYIAASLWLGHLMPNVLVVSNDHTMPNRVIVKAANEKGIPTIYIQHASVTDEFPPLMYDYALLEGMDALHKYENIDPTETKVFLVGMLKTDEYYHSLNTHEEARSIGICTNELDPLNRVQDLCNTLNIKFPSIRFYLRPHPGDKRYIWNTLSKKYGMSLSNSRTEQSFIFLNNVDAIISGDSNIILEAALMNIYPIYYDFAQTDLDWYGFISHGLVEYFSDTESVRKKIEELIQLKPIVRCKAKRYCHTINTPYDGHSTELAAKLIQHIANGQEVHMNEWRRISNVNLNAYEIIV